MYMNMFKLKKIKLRGIRNDRKRKKQEETQKGLYILFLYPLIFDTKIPRDNGYSPFCVSTCFFSFSVETRGDTEGTTV